MGEVIRAQFLGFTPEEQKKVRQKAMQKVMTGYPPAAAIQNAENEVMADKQAQITRERNMQELDRLLAEKGYRWGGNALLSSTQVQEGEGPA